MILYVPGNAHRIWAGRCKLRGYRGLNPRILAWLLVYSALLTAYFVFVNVAGDEKGIGRVIELYLTMPASFVFEYLFAIIRPPGVFNTAAFFSKSRPNCCLTWHFIVYYL